METNKLSVVLVNYWCLSSEISKFLVPVRPVCEYRDVVLFFAPIPGRFATQHLVRVCIALLLIVDLCCRSHTPLLHVAQVSCLVPSLQHSFHVEIACLPHVLLFVRGFAR